MNAVYQISFVVRKRPGLVHMIPKEKNEPKGYAANRSKQLPERGSVIVWCMAM